MPGLAIGANTLTNTPDRMPFQNRGMYLVAIGSALYALLLDYPISPPGGDFEEDTSWDYPDYTSLTFVGNWCLDMYSPLEVGKLVVLYFSGKLWVAKVVVAVPDHLKTIL